MYLFHFGQFQCIWLNQMEHEYLNRYSLLCSLASWNRSVMLMLNLLPVLSSLRIISNIIFPDILRYEIFKITRYKSLQRLSDEIEHLNNGLKFPLEQCFIRGLVWEFKTYLFQFISRKIVRGWVCSRLDLFGSSCSSNLHICCMNAEYNSSTHPQLSSSKEKQRTNSGSGSLNGSNRLSSKT